LLGDFAVPWRFLIQVHVFSYSQTRVQASTLSFPELISKLPQIGIQGLYRGSIPAILGQFSRFVLFHGFTSICQEAAYSHHAICSHGLRTGIFEASKLILVRVAPTLPEIQVRFINFYQHQIYLSYMVFKFGTIHSASHWHWV
jgi:phosphatidylinositol phospholipase C delta